METGTRWARNRSAAQKEANQRWRRRRRRRQRRASKQQQQQQQQQQPQLQREEQNKAADKRRVFEVALLMQSEKGRWAGRAPGHDSDLSSLYLCLSVCLSVCLSYISPACLPILSLIHFSCLLSVWLCSPLNYSSACLSPSPHPIPYPSRCLLPVCLFTSKQQGLWGRMGGGGGGGGGGDGGVGKKAARELTAALVFEASITASDTLPGLTW